MNFVELKKGIKCLKSEIGGKGYGLLQLLNLDLNIPRTAVVCEQKGELSDETVEGIKAFVQSVVHEDKNATFAVRSSGISEDGKKRSFAGMFQTFLNVQSDDVIQKVYEVKNFTTKRLVAYSNQSKEKESLELAVVIQKMIIPKVSGIAFSKNPVTNNKDEIMIEYVEGEGEKLVGGEETPSQIIYNKKSQQYTVEIEDGHPELSNSVISELCNKILKIEQSLSCFIDVEFCTEKNDRLCFLQARPITT